MALFKINKGQKKNLPTTYTEGYCYFTTDDGKFYIDTSNTSDGRILLNAGKADSVNVTTLASGTDLNNLTTPGYYGVAASATAQAFTNNPLSGTATGIIVKVYNVDDLIYQEVYGTLGGGMYKRRKSGTSWGGWVQFATTSDNVASATALKTGRTFKVNLASTSASSAFNGTANITNIGVSGTLPIANGGTGATTAAGARTNLGVPPTSHASTATTYGVSSATNYGHAMASSTTPKANGTAALGSETAKFARGDHVHPLQTTVSGNAGTATKLATARTISLTGDVTGSVSFDGSANASITATVVDNSHSHSDYAVAYRSCSSKDLNSITTTGFYYGYIGMTNAAVQAISVLEVINYSADWIVQRQTVISATPITYERTRYDGTTWSDWHEIYTTVNKPTCAEIGAAAASHTHSYLPLSGGTVTGEMTFSSASFGTTTVQRTTGGGAAIKFKPSINTETYFAATNMSDSFYRYLSDTTTYYKIHDDGNLSYSLDGATLTITKT